MGTFFFSHIKPGYSAGSAKNQTGNYPDADQLSGPSHFCAIRTTVASSVGISPAEPSAVTPHLKVYTMSNINYLTNEGYHRLRNELEELKTTGRSEVAQAIAEAREKGDLSENAEYDAAKDAQGLLELKINEMEKVLANARILDESTLDASKVTVLSNVTIKNVKNGFEITYKLVSESEADLKAKKISVNSPMGKGLLGKKVGDVADIHTPNGEMQFEIKEITVG